MEATTFQGMEYSKVASCHPYKTKKTSRGGRPHSNDAISRQAASLVHKEVSVRTKDQNYQSEPIHPYALSVAGTKEHG